MILNQNNRNIERSGIRVEREATIVADAVAFKVLSDMLYPDKPLAIIRELMCNAYDSHTAAGKPDEPVHIHLPNIMEPYLSIRDFGLGLSFRDACVLMLTYFKSTKRDNNTVTGALGLGSKTPFSYVDSYTVTTRYNGRKFTFNAFINENGNPSMALLARERTTEGNGVEIMVPVRRSDFNVFIDRARTVLEWFRIPPVVTGCKEFKINKTEYETLGSTWKIAKMDGHYGYWGRHGTSYAIQGNIAYPIKVESMPELPAGYAELFRMPIYMEFPIGEISFTAGRDAISYDKATVANLIAGMDRVVKELPLQSQTKFDACETKWDAHCLYADMLTNSMSGAVIRVLNQHKKLSFKWKTLAIDTSTVAITMKGHTNPLVTVLFGGSSKSRRHTSEEAIQVTANSKTVFYIDDLPKGGVTRLRSYRAANTPSNDLILLGSESIDVEEKRKVIDLMLADLGNPPFKLVSSLPPKKRNPTNVLSRKTNKVVTVDDSSYYANNFGNSATDIEFDDGGYYVPVQRGKAVDSKGFVYTNFSALLRQAAVLKLIPNKTVIVAVNPSQMKKFQGSEDWVNAIDHITEKFVAHLDNNNVADEIATVASYNEIMYTWSRHYANSFAHNKAILNTFSVDHPIRIFVENFTKQNGAAKSIDVNTLTTMASWLSVNIKTSGSKGVYNFKDAWDEIANTYPIIRLINYPDNNTAKTILKYVQDVDRLAEIDRQPVKVPKIKILKP